VKKRKTGHWKRAEVREERKTLTIDSIVLCHGGPNRPERKSDDDDGLPNFHSGIPINVLPDLPYRRRLGPASP